jgi:hypothetical protein
MGPVRRPGSGITPAVWVTICIALVPAICSIAVTGYIANQANEKADAIKRELKVEIQATEARLGEKIKDIDVNSANRRNESQAEMMRLDESRAQQVMQLRQDLRDHMQEVEHARRP